MSEKTLKTRIIHKHAVESDWEKSSLIPKQAELIVYDKDENYDFPRIKLGDGLTNVNDLPFASHILTEETIIDVLAEEDMLVAVYDSDGSILTDANGDILSM